MYKPDLQDLATADWRMLIDPNTDENEVSIVRPDEGRPGALVGPLATVFMGVTFSDDEGEDKIDLTGEDGLVLRAIAMLPQMAELCCFIRNGLGELMAIVANDEHAAALRRFCRELKAREEWIREGVSDRDEDMPASGMHSVSRYRGAP